MVNGFKVILTMHDSMQPGGLLTFRVNLPDARYAKLPARVQFFDRLLVRLKTLPGVESAALGKCVPFGDCISVGELSLEGRPARARESRQALYQYVNADWFHTFRILLKAGRLPNEQDGADTLPVAAISERLAQKYWPGESPLGKRIKLGGDDSDNPWMTVVGVTGDIQYVWWNRGPSPVIYMPYRQASRQLMQFVLRAPADPLALSETVRKEVTAVDPDMPIYSLKTEERVISESIAGIRYVAALMTVLGFIALVLASVGLYGVMAYAVAERTHEIGVRMALGARAREVIRLVLARGITLTLLGLTIGLALSYTLARTLSSLVFGVSATDATTFSGMAGLLAVVACAAAYIPATRATRVHPLIALRHE